MPDPIISLQGLIYGGITLGAVVAGYKAQGLRRNGKNGKPPWTEERHELLCERNLLRLSKEFQKHVSNEVGKLYNAIKEVTKPS